MILPGALIWFGAGLGGSSGLIQRQARQAKCPTPQPVVRRLRASGLSALFGLLYPDCPTSQLVFPLRAGKVGVQCVLHERAKPSWCASRLGRFHGESGQANVGEMSSAEAGFSTVSTQGRVRHFKAAPPLLRLPKPACHRPKRHTDICNATRFALVAQQTSAGDSFGHEPRLLGITRGIAAPVGYVGSGRVHKT